MGIKLLWFLLIWILIGLLCSSLTQRMLHKEENKIEDGKREMLPLVSLIYSMMDAIPGILQIACIIGWPYFIYAGIYNFVDGFIDGSVQWFKSKLK